MKVETYVNAAMERHGIASSKGARERIKSTLGFSEVRASDDLSENTKRIIDRLCERLKRGVVADDPKPGVIDTPVPQASGKFEESLARGVDPTTGNKVIRVVLNAKENRVAYFDPVQRAAYPVPRDVTQLPVKV